MKDEARAEMREPRTKACHDNRGIKIKACPEEFRGNQFENFSLSEAWTLILAFLTPFFSETNLRSKCSTNLVWSLFYPEANQL